MPLKGLVHSSSARLSSSATVRAACQSMHDAKTGAVMVVDQDKLQGIFTYRDLIDRVILAKRDFDSVALKEVMTRDVHWIPVDHSPGDALRIMVENDYTHLPVLDEAGHLAGLLTVRSLLEHQIHKLADELDTIMGFLSIDGSGGD